MDNKVAEIKTALMDPEVRKAILQEIADDLKVAATPPTMPVLARIGLFGKALFANLMQPKNAICALFGAGDLLEAFGNFFPWIPPGVLSTVGLLVRTLFPTTTKSGGK